MNILDSLKHLSVPEIKDHYNQLAIDASIAMVNTMGDFNFSTAVRNANFFGFSSVCYISPSKKWDRRGSVGTHHYTDIIHYKSEAEFLDAIEQDYTIVAVENNIPSYANKTISVYDMDLIYRPMFIFGEENKGLSSFILDRADLIITIPTFGTVRSLNVGTTSGIIMNQYRMNLEKDTKFYG
jgi:tRNA G18 (ribose-2'-O)-methylase SpoU